MAVFFGPAVDPGVGNVGKEEITAVADVDRAFGPAETGGDTLDRGVADLGEALIQRFHSRVRVVPIRQGSEVQRFRRGRP